MLLFSKLVPCPTTSLLASVEINSHTNWLCVFHIPMACLLCLCRFEEEGITVPDVGVGSTPTASRPVDDMRKLTEMHPGNYIFYGKMG